MIIHAARSRSGEERWMSLRSFARLCPRHYQRDHPFLAFGLILLAVLCPAELGFRLPKPMEQNSELARFGPSTSISCFPHVWSAQGRLTRVSRLLAGS
jgi:hypothetical protein